VHAQPRTVQTGFSRIADALADPAREAIVAALFDGRAMPAGELATVAGISPQSASAHLQKMVEARVLSVWEQGRFRYYRIRDDYVAALVESLVDLAAKADTSRAKRVPARSCAGRGPALPSRREARGLAVPCAEPA
jgi:DNA-binding transcriptional ArsR family regulator